MTWFVFPLPLSMGSTVVVVGADILTFVDGLPEPDRSRAMEVIEAVELRLVPHYAPVSSCCCW